MHYFDLFHMTYCKFKFKCTLNNNTGTLNMATSELKQFTADIQKY